MSIIKEMLGQTFSKVYVNDMDDELYFINDEIKITFYHSQECCEQVYIEDIVGDLSDLIGETILLAEVASSDENELNDSSDYIEWTFYKFATRKGYVDIRWFGSSNGYYATGVSMKIEKLNS